MLRPTPRNRGALQIRPVPALQGMRCLFHEKSLSDPKDLLIPFIET